MPPRYLTPLLPLALALTLIAPPAQADGQAYRVLLGGRSLGTFDFVTTRNTQGRLHILNAVLNNTPLGVFNGTFTGRSQSKNTGVQYESTSKSTRKTRVITVDFADNRATKTAIDPTSEETKLSQIDAVPGNVLDPVAGFGRLLTDSECPALFRFYDGRRVVQVTSAKQARTDTTLTCHMSYKVIAGPGHLSPFRFTNFGMEVDYQTTGDAGRGPSEIRMRTGPFELRLVP